MEIGKVPNELLEAIILKRLKFQRSEVITRPGIGEDCCVVDFGEYVCVMSTDPITGTSEEIGRLAVNVSCNDIASAGVEPLGLMVTLLAPAGTSEQELEKVMDQLIETAASIKVDVIGGHTEITASVNQFVIVCTAIGRAVKGRPVSTGGAKAGDSLIMTKFAGMEGAAIIALENETELLKELGKDTVEEAKAFIRDTSVVDEGVASGLFGVSAMHDITEGGVLGAVWEMCEASSRGALIYRSRIPIADSIDKICRYYGIDPLRLMSSGCMLISCNDGDGLVKLLKEKGIPASVIGRVDEGTERLMETDGSKVSILPPGPDELYKVKGHSSPVRGIDR